MDNEKKLNIENEKLFKKIANLVKKISNGEFDTELASLINLVLLDIVKGKQTNQNPGYIFKSKLMEKINNDSVFCELAVIFFIDNTYELVKEKIVELMNANYNNCMIIENNNRTYNFTSEDEMSILKYYIPINMKVFLVEEFLNILNEIGVGEGKEETIANAFNYTLDKANIECDNLIADIDNKELGIDKLEDW